MTSNNALHRIGTPVLSALATAAVFTCALWVQHTRAEWRFNRPAAAVVAEGMVGTVATSGADATHQRVALDTAAAQSLDIRLETVGRQSLTQTVRAVATVAPDESRISHVHTRVAGWIEDTAKGLREKVEAAKQLTGTLPAAASVPV